MVFGNPSAEVRRRATMQLKRKDPGATDPENVQVPSKRWKPSWEHPLPTILEEASVPIVEDGPSVTVVVEEPTPIVGPEVCPVEVPSDVSAGNGPQPRLYVTEPDADERALVLYKPMSKPEHLSSFPRNYKDFQVSNAVDWFSPSKSFRQLGNRSTNNSLAVIPYMTPYTVYSDSGARSGTDSCGGRVIIEDITDQVQEEENVDPMAVEDTAAPMEADVVEDMDIMDVSPAPEEFPVQQLPAPSFGAPQWQRFGSQHTPVSW